MTSDDSDQAESPLPESALSINRQRNRSTRDAWSAFATHREISTNLTIHGTMQSAPHQQSPAQLAERGLCVLGAGNSNDLELSRICQYFSTIRLVDMDEEALEISAEKYRQAASALNKHLDLQCSAVDVTGLFDDPEPSDVNLDAMASHPLSLILYRLNHFRLPIPQAGYDNVVSSCLLSQIVGSLQTLISEGQADFVNLVIAVRRKHLEQMIDLLRPGGRGVLITDFVSSLTWPDLNALTDQQLNQTAVQVIQQGNFFTGCNPLAIRTLLLNDPYFAQRINQVRLSPCWRWDLGSKQMAVAALTFVKMT